MAGQMGRADRRVTKRGNAHGRLANGVVDLPHAARDEQTGKHHAGQKIRRQHRQEEIRDLHLDLHASLVRSQPTGLRRKISGSVIVFKS